MDRDGPQNSGIPLSANGAAYTRREGRHGVPLDYVGEKLASSIQELHTLARRNPEQRADFVPTMYYLLVSYLALNNMLGKADDRGLPERLLAIDHDELSSWLEFVRDQGDVLGIEDAEA